MRELRQPLYGQQTGVGTHLDASPSFLKSQGVQNAPAPVGPNPGGEDLVGDLDPAVGGIVGMLQDLAQVPDEGAGRGVLPLHLLAGELEGVLGGAKCGGGEGEEGVLHGAALVWMFWRTDGELVGGGGGGGEDGSHAEGNEVEEEVSPGRAKDPWMAHPGGLLKGSPGIDGALGCFLPLEINPEGFDVAVGEVANV